MEANREIKRLFDPSGVMNPGKIIDDGRFKIDRDLRLGEGSTIDLPFEPQLGFVHKDGSFVGNLEQCNGCGGCRKDPPTMCPTFVATGEEIQSTRGRANAIRAALDGKFEGLPLETRELEEALSSCLSCKACRTECPSNVDLAALKADLLQARRRTAGTPIRDRVIAAADLLGRAGTRLPALVNGLLGSVAVRTFMEKTLGLNAARPLPSYADQRFDAWFETHRSTIAPSRGKVVLWDDTWVRYHEPGIGRAAVSVLEKLRFDVRLAVDRRCCGRPAFSRGLLTEARRAGEHNVALLGEWHPEAPIVFLEPSCWSMFVDEYLQLGIEGAAEVASRCVLFEDLVEGVIASDPGAIDFDGREASVAIHDHCHAKALRDGSVMPRLAGRIPGATVELLETGCCGMAGAFGMLKAKDELSREVARPLVQLIDGLPDTAEVVASGTSCRHQIEHLTDAKPLHIAELLANHLITD
jgi:Fe-S oxidoreductase